MSVYILFSEGRRLVAAILYIGQVKRNIFLESSSVNFRDFNLLNKLSVKLSQRLEKIVIAKKVEFLKSFWIKNIHVFAVH